MKKSIKIALLVSTVLVLVGGIMVGVAFACGAVFEQPSHAVTYMSEGYFRNVVIRGGEANVRILPSETGECYAVCNEIDRVTYELSVKAETLYVSVIDTRRWFDYFGIHVGNPLTVTLYLPPKGDGESYGFLDVSTQSGDIVSTDPTLPFADVALSVNSGNIYYTSPVSLTFAAIASSGNIEVYDLQTDTMTLSISSGNISLSTCNATELSLTTSSGKVNARDIVAGKTFSVKTYSGRITLHRCNAPTLTLSASSGIMELQDIVSTETLTADTMSGSIILHDCQASDLDLAASSGKIDLRHVTVAQKLSAETTSGNISLLDCTAGELALEASSGKVTLENVTAAETLSVITQSGNISLQKCDAPTLSLSAKSGNVKGVLLSDKMYDVRSNSGKILCPSSVEGHGTCTVRTSSGNISLVALQ